MKDCKEFSNEHHCQAPQTGECTKVQECGGVKEFLYGDRVRFNWVDADYYYNTDLMVNWEGELEGLYGGIYECKSTPEKTLATVTVTSDGQYRGKILHPRVEELRLVDHPEIHSSKEKETKCTMTERLYDKKALYEMRDEIIDNFDFGKVAETMELLDWGWCDSDSFETHIPEESEIRREARRLIDDLIERVGTDEQVSGIETGGFAVSFEEYDGIPNIRLQFVLTDWEEGYDCWDEYQKRIDKRKSKGKFKPIAES